MAPSSRSPLSGLLGSLMVMAGLSGGAHAGEALIDNPSAGEPEYVIRQLIQAALTEDPEEGWGQFRAWLHSDQLASPASERSWKTMNYAAFRRSVRHLLPDESKPVFRRAYVEKIGGGRHEYLKVFVVSKSSDMPKPFHLMRDPQAEQDWRLNGSLN